MEQRKLMLSDGHELFYRVWDVPEAKATLHINHGMAEHSLRYSRFAKYLNSLGIAVYAQDHRGHGLTKAEDEKGWFAEKDGWRLVVDDSWELDKAISNDYPQLPHILFGHSMGSFIARVVLSEHSAAFFAVIICGTGASQGLIGKFGKALASRHSRKLGSKMPDQTFERIAFGSYTRHFPGEGNFGWLSRDKEEVRKYEDDPLCGFTCSSGFYCDLLTLIEKANDATMISSIRKDIPIMLISGDKDPVGGYGKGVMKVHRLYKKAGIHDVRLVLLPDDRHEILNELDRDVVEKTMGAFILETIGEHDE